MLTRRDLIVGCGSLMTGAALHPLKAIAMVSTDMSPHGLWDQYWVGTSYYPEQWSSRQWASDFGKMAAMGVNTVRMAEFAWSSMEPSQGHFEFAWLDQAISLAHANGIQVLLGTPTAGVPPWLYKLHPEVLGANQNGNYSYGGRKGFSIDSPAMREAARQMILRMAERYGSNPAVVGWQISNEPGYPFENYDHHSLLAFRAWLQQRYKTIAALNEAWGGKFWSNEYDDFSEIQFLLNPAEGANHPGMRIDYRHFFSDSFLRWIKFETELIRPHAPNQILFTNWPDTHWSVDLFAAARLLDVTAWDNYGIMAGDGDFHQQWFAAMNHDLCRCTRPDHRFFVAEERSQPPVGSDPLVVRLQAYMDIAHGSSGTVFFEWRSPLASNEMGYVSMLEADGTPGITADQLSRLSKELGRISPRLSKATTHSRVAMLYSYPNHWDRGGWQTDPLKSKGNYADSGPFQRFYGGAKVLGNNIDILPPEASLSQYRIVIAPGLQMLSDEVFSGLEVYVRQGGILVIDRRAGTQDDFGRLRPLVAPGLFTAMAGVRVESNSRTHNQNPQTAIVFDGKLQRFKVNGEIERLRMEGAQPLALLEGEGVEGVPAVTIHAYESGHVVYAATESDDAEFYDLLFDVLGQKFHIEPILQVPKGVEVVSRKGENREWIFLLNLTSQKQQIALPFAGVELLSGQSVSSSLKLEGFEVAVIERVLENL
jgi:beta-galactosidase